MNFKFFLFTLLCCFMCSSLYAQKFSIAARMGYSPFSNARYETPHYHSPILGPGILLGLKFAYEAKVVQPGVAVDWLLISESTLTNPGLLVNFRLGDRRNYAFAGAQLGLLIPGKSNSGSYGHTLTMGTSAGIQAGGQMLLSRHFYACAEASFRYGNYYMGLGKVSFFYYPLVLSLKYVF